VILKRLSGKTVFIATAVIVAGGLIGLFIVGMMLATQPGNRPDAGSRVPDFSVTLFSGYRTNLPERIKVSDLQGKVVLVNFWASWCVECRKESDAIEQAWRQYKDKGLVVLGIDYLDTESAAIKYLEEYNTSYAIGTDTQEQISRAFHITGVPESFFIDRKGTIRKVVIQAMTQQELVTAVEDLLKE
jgi:cytochrome c biogenesis protein CcmG/thiol:disulfide interchange protein DsbE